MLRPVNILRVVCLSAAIALPVAAQSPPQGQITAPTISTSGQGEAKVTPDRASVMVSVQTRGTTAAAAAADNAQRIAAVLAALSRIGLAKDQLSTEGYSVSPEMKYDNVGGTSKVVGYVVTNRVRAETRKPEQAGAIIDAALGAGANLINSLSFYASSIDVARREAMGSAVANARADAEAIAKAMGMVLGGPVEISTSGPTAPPRPMFDMAMAKSAGAMATPINAGDQTVSVYISAKWFVIPR